MIKPSLISGFEWVSVMGLRRWLGPDIWYTWETVIGGELWMRQKIQNEKERGIYVTTLPLCYTWVETTPPQLQNSAEPKNKTQISDREELKLMHLKTTT